MGIGIVRKGDMGDGADGFTPRANIEGSPNVFVNGLEVHRIGDAWPLHCKPKAGCHTSVLAEGSNTVFANGKGVGRIGDAQSCGAHAIQGSSNVFSG